MDANFEIGKGRFRGGPYKTLDFPFLFVLSMYSIRNVGSGGSCAKCAMLTYSTKAYTVARNISLKAKKTTAFTRRPLGVAPQFQTA
jgi:hypothetical protein